MESIVLINPYQVAAGQEEACLAIWREADDYLRRQDGFIARKLHASLDPGARFRFVNVAVWRSVVHFQRAIATAEFQQIVERLPCPNFPSLYQIVAD